MTPGNSPPPIILGKKNARKYRDMLGREINVGDIFAHATARSSSVYMNLYKIKEIIPLDAPAHVGSESLPGGGYRRIQSWDTAFKLKVITMEFSAMEGIKLPKVWDSNSGKYSDVPEDEHKLKTISAVDRIVRV